MNTDSKEELSDRIVRLVEEHWAERKTALLLSNLGNSDHGAIGRHAKDRSGSLKAYVRDALSDRVKIIQHSSRFAVIGALPAGAELDDNVNVDDLFPVADAQDLHSPARYHRALWAAFRLPLSNDKGRYVSADGPVRFVDVAAGSAPEGFVQVDGELVDPADGDPRSIEGRILKWVADNDLDVSRFQARTQGPDPGSPSDDLLGQVLDALGPEELRRLSMPLDIVQKLRGRRR